MKKIGNIEYYFDELYTLNTDTNETVAYAFYETMEKKYINHLMNYYDDKLENYESLSWWGKVKYYFREFW